MPPTTWNIPPVLALLLIVAIACGDKKTEFTPQTKEAQQPETPKTSKPIALSISEIYIRETPSKYIKIDRDGLIQFYGVGPKDGETIAALSSDGIITKDGETIAILQADGSIQSDIPELTAFAIDELGAISREGTVLMRINDKGNIVVDGTPQSTRIDGPATSHQAASFVMLIASSSL